MRMRGSTFLWILVAVVGVIALLNSGWLFASPMSGGWNPMGNGYMGDGPTDRGHMSGGWGMMGDMGGHMGGMGGHMGGMGGHMGGWDEDAAEACPMMGRGGDREEELPALDPDASLERVEATVRLDEWTLEPGTLEAEVGQRLVLTIENTGSVAHTLAIPELGLRTGRLAAGETRTVEVDLTQAGTFEVFCDVPGHRQAGQTGTLVVSGQ